MRITFSIGIATYFAPQDDLEEKVIAEIGRAQDSICIQAYKFASPRIKDALLLALRDKRDRQESLVLKILLDGKETRKSQKALEDKPASSDAAQAALIQALGSGGADIKCISERDIDKSHNKVMIIDEKTVLTGSFNYKPQPNRVQVDNLLILEHAGVAKNYQKMFDNYFQSGNSCLQSCAKG